MAKRSAAGEPPGVATAEPGLSRRSWVREPASRAEERGGKPRGSPDDSPYATREPNAYPPLHELAAWTKEDYQRALAGSAMKRATLTMLRRNAKVALRNAANASVRKADRHVEDVGV